MPIGLVPECFECLHMTGVSSDHGWTCSAFPQGIPVQVLCRQISHREPIEGDGGVVFEPAVFGQEMRADEARVDGDVGKDIELNPKAGPLLAAGVMYLTDDGQVLFLRRSDTGEWAFPGGKIEEGESAQLAATRECEEEIGNSPTELRQWTRRILGGVDFTTFVARVPETFEPKLNDEHTEYSWEPLGDHSGRSLDHLMGGIHQLVQPTLTEIRADSDETAHVHVLVAPDLGDDNSGVSSRHDADIEFKESEHPRDGDGKFTSGGGGGGGISETTTKKLSKDGFESSGENTFKHSSGFSVTSKFSEKWGTWGIEVKNPEGKVTASGGSFKSPEEAIERSQPSFMREIRAFEKKSGSVPAASAKKPSSSPPPPAAPPIVKQGINLPVAKANEIVPPISKTERSTAQPIKGKSNTNINLVGTGKSKEALAKALSSTRYPGLGGATDGLTVRSVEQIKSNQQTVAGDIWGVSKVVGGSLVVEVADRKNPDPVGVMSHEIGHMADRLSDRKLSSDIGLKLSLNDEFSSMTASEQNAARYFRGSEEERFAELYKLMTSPSKKGAFFLSQERAEKIFSRSLGKLRDLFVESRADARLDAAVSEMDSLLRRIRLDEAVEHLERCL